MKKLLLVSIIALFLTGPVLAADSDNPIKEIISSEWVSFSGEYFLGYKAGNDGGTDYSVFEIRRAYLTAKKTLVPGLLSSRITLDTNQDGDGDGEGDMEARIKYAYAKLHLKDFLFINKASVEFGMVHAPWLDYEQSIDHYRMRDKMFIERVGIVNSGDFGVTFFGLLGGEMDKEFKKKIGKKYAGYWGSFALGLYNGGGYHAVENNTNKTFEARLSLRPLPIHLPGLQVSYFLTNGEGNKAGFADETPDWVINSFFISYQAPSYTLTGQYASGEGNQKGSWYFDNLFFPNDISQALEWEGYSVFGEKKFLKDWLVIAGYDFFDPDSRLEEDTYTTVFGGVGYDFGGKNILLFDYNVKNYEASNVDSNTWMQVTMQIKF